MSKKYKFNPETFSYQKDSKASKISKIILMQIVAIVFLSLIVFYVLSFIKETPQEKNLKYENNLMEREYEKMLNIYEQNEKNLKALEKQDKGLYKIMFGTEIDDNSDEKKYITDYKDEKPRILVRKNKEKLEKIYNNLREKKQEYIEFLDNLKNNPQKVNNIPSIQPVPNPNLQLLIYGYGYRLDPIYHTPHFHTGIDYSAPIGTPVFATADGVVRKSGRGERTLGNIIEIDHGDYSTYYYHLNDVSVRYGRKVKKGDLIGHVGTTGKSLIPHLHYEIRYKDETVNPIFFYFMELSTKQFAEIYEMSVIAGISLD